MPHWFDPGSRFHTPLIGRVEDWRAGLGRCRATFPAPSTSSGRWRFRRRRGSASTRFFKPKLAMRTRPLLQHWRRSAIGPSASISAPCLPMRKTASMRPRNVLAYRARRCSTNGDRRDVPGVAPMRPRQLHPTQYGRDLVLAARPPCRSDARTATRRHSEASRFTRQDAVLQRPASSGTASSYSSYTPTPDGVTRINERTKKSATGKFRTRLGGSAAHFVATDRE